MSHSKLRKSQQHRCLNMYSTKMMPINILTWKGKAQKVSSVNEELHTGNKGMLMSRRNNLLWVRAFQLII